MFASGKTAAVASAANYIEDVFSTYLYTGTGSAQSIVNNIDLSTKGGLTWLKRRDAVGSQVLYDTARGATKLLSSNNTDAEATATGGLTAFNVDGFSLGANYPNTNTATFASWTFRKQAKFFDVVTYTGNGGTPQNISHSLGSVPGFIVVKPTSTTGGWICYHRSLTASGYNPAPYNTINLNSTGSIMEDTGAWDSTAPTSTVFTIGSSPSVNTNGATYVAYLFAHNAGGFGLTGTDNVISCGSVAVTGSQQDVNLGYEPQWILWKKTSGSLDWWMFDTMRGLVVDNGSGTGDKPLYANLSNAEGSTYGIDPTATGFQLSAGWGSGDFIYIAIRRGPMKVPTTGTSVFSPAAETPSGSANYVMNSSSGFPVDMLLYKARNNVATPYLTNRLTNNYLQTASTAAEASYTYGYDLMQGVRGQFDATSQVDYAFRRAPSFFDEVCYTGTGSATTFTHNLGVAPELMIVKNRSSAGYGWLTYSATLGATKYLQVNSTAAEGTVSTYWNNTAPTSSVFSVGTAGATNASGDTFVAYLFATCPGVSKVGSYTGNGSTQTINCGFTGGARFVLIKCTSTTGDWYVYDTARGMTTLTDPYLLLNSTAAESATLGSVTTVSTGFALNAGILAAINTNGASYIFLAVS